MKMYKIIIEQEMIRLSLMTFVFLLQKIIEYIWGNAAAVEEHGQHKPCVCLFVL